MADCKEYLNQISELIDGELSQRQEAELNAHIESCPACRRVYDAFIGISRALPDELIEPPENFTEAIMQIVNPRQEVKKENKKNHVWRYLAAAACFTLVCIGAWSQGLFSATSTLAGASGDLELALAPQEGVLTSGSLDLNLNLSLPEGTDIYPYSGSNETVEPETIIDPQASSIKQFGLQRELLNSDFASNKAFLESELTRLSGCEAISVYEGEFIPGDEEYAGALPVIELLDDKSREELLLLMTHEALLEYSEKAEEGLEPYCTLVFNGVKLADGQGSEDIAVTVWIIDGWLVFKISGETPILFLSETLPIDFEEFLGGQGVIDRNMQS